MKINDQHKIWNNSTFLFFVLPILFYFIIALTGYHLFYNRGKFRFEKKQIILLSAGSFFYLILVLVVVYKL
jgi:hypothetical protein